MPRQDHRPLGIVDQLQRLFVLVRSRRKIGAISRQLRRHRLSVEIAGGLLRVLGNVHEHWPRTAGTRDIKCFADRLRDLVGMRDQIVVLGDGQRDARNVGLLKRVRANELASHLPRNANDRRGIEHRRGNSGDHIGGARTGCSDGHTHAP